MSDIGVSQSWVDRLYHRILGPTIPVWEALPNINPWWRYNTDIAR